MHKTIESRIRSTLESEISGVTNLENSIPHIIEAIDLIQKRSGKIVVTGIGKSGFIGMKISATLTSLGHPSVFIHPVEAVHGDLGIVTKGDVLIAISFSGETKEVVRLVQYLEKSLEVKVVSITGCSTSTLATISESSIDIQIDNEGCPINAAPMASTAATLVVGDLLASGLTSPEVFEQKHFAQFHPSGSLGLSFTKVADVIQKDITLPLVEVSHSFHEVLVEMTDKKFGVTGVIDSKGTLVGIITDGDIRRFLLKEKNVENKTAQDMMTPNPRVITQEASLKEALSQMEEYKVTTLFLVSDERKPIALVHMHDIIENTLR